MTAHFSKLLDYNIWANRRFMACLLNNTIVNNKVYLLFSHLLTAEEVWLSRVAGKGSGPVLRLWELYPNDRLQQMLEESSGAWQTQLKSLQEEDFQQLVTYQNSKGESFSTRLDDVITHMVNHGTHHRAQIASMLQQEKIQAPASDYIVYVREQQ